MKALTCLFCVLFALLSSCPALLADGQGHFSEEIKNQKLKVMTYNVHHCNPPSAGDKIDVEAIARAINAEKPDLVALQEIDVNTIRSGKGKNQAKQLAELTGMHFFFSKAIDHEGGDYGVAVLSRFPILDFARYSLPIHPDKKEEMRTVAAITILLSSKQKMIFASTHLGLIEANRLLQAAEIVKNIGKSDLPVVLAGDFNAAPESAVIKYLDGYFTRTCVKDCGPTIPVEKPSETIDFIMYSPKSSFKTLSNRVISEKYASDHLPVVAELLLEK